MALNNWDRTALILAAIGALNWGLAELGWNAVANLIGSWSPLLASIVYYIVGVAGAWTLYSAFK